MGVGQHVWESTVRRATLFRHRPERSKQNIILHKINLLQHNLQREKSDSSSLKEMAHTYNCGVAL